MTHLGTNGSVADPDECLNLLVIVQPRHCRLLFDYVLADVLIMNVSALFVSPFHEKWTIEKETMKNIRKNLCK